MLKLAVIFHRIGPYHRVRLEAAGRHGEVWCIEGGGKDSVYAWDEVAPGRSFRKLTLFAQADSSAMKGTVVDAAVFKALRQVEPMVVVIPGWEDKLALAGLRWAVKSHTPVVVLSDSHQLGGARCGPKELVKRRLVGLCNSGLVAGKAAKAYLNKLGMCEDRILTGFDVVDNGHFANRAAKTDGSWSDFRGKLGIPGRFFLCPARFIWEKNLSRLLKAYSRYRMDFQDATAKREGAPWSLVLLGDGPLRHEVCSEIQELGLTDSVFLPGFKQYEELPKFYALASAVVLPSVSETWGLAINEAMASGLPVLVSNRCGCAPDLVHEGINGFTFDPYNVEELAQLMGRVALMPSERLTAMGSASRQIVEHWSPEFFAANLWRAAETAMAQPPPKASVLEKIILRSLLMR